MKSNVFAACSALCVLTLFGSLACAALTQDGSKPRTAPTEQTSAKTQLGSISRLLQKGPAEFEEVFGKPVSVGRSKFQTFASGKSQFIDLEVYKYDAKTPRAAIVTVGFAGLAVRELSVVPSTKWTSGTWQAVCKALGFDVAKARETPACIERLGGLPSRLQLQWSKEDKTGEASTWIVYVTTEKQTYTGK